MNMMKYIIGFPYIELSLHLWHDPYIVMVYSLLCVRLASEKSCTLFCIYSQTVLNTIKPIYVVKI